MSTPPHGSRWRRTGRRQTIASRDQGHPRPPKPTHSPTATSFPNRNKIALAAGKPLLGFANPFFYAGKIGATLPAAGITDVKAPTPPTALLRGYANDLTRVRAVTINAVPNDIATVPSAPQICGSTICHGIDDIFNDTTKGHDNVTGLACLTLPSSKGKQGRLF